MKNYFLVGIIVLLSNSCNGQKQESKATDNNKSESELVEQPQGSWKVDREYDANGNLISYDSIYSWASNKHLNKLSAAERDSLMQSLKSRFFTSFSGFRNQGFDAVFCQDSLFSKRFFTDDFFESDFGTDFRALEKIRQQMITQQKKFLKKYQSGIGISEDEN